MRWSFAGVVAIVLTGLLPATALGETRYVAKTGSDSSPCTSAAAPCLTVQYAVNQSAAGDTIQIGAGDFYESVVAGVPLNFLGAGAGQIGAFPAKTQIRGVNGTTGSGSPGLQLKEGGTVESLRVEGGAGGSGGGYGEPGADAIDYASTSAAPTTLRLADVVLAGGKGGLGNGVSVGTGGDAMQVTSGPGAVALSATASQFAGGAGHGGGTAILVYGPAAEARVTGSQVLNRGVFGGALFDGGGGRLGLDDVDVESDGQALGMYEGAVTIRRSRLHSLGTAVYATTSGKENPRLQLLDSLLVSETGFALEVESEAEGTAAAEVIGSTLIGNYLAAVEAHRKEDGGPATVTLRNSLAYVTQRVAPFFSPVDLKANGGQIVADYSSFSSRLAENGGSVTAPGSAHNVSGDPGFIDAAHDVYLLQNGSPLIDRGDPGIVAPGELDLLGSPRSLDGNHDCAAAPDIGAFEVTGQSAPCPAATAKAGPVVSGFGMTNRVFAPLGAHKGAHAGALGSAARVKRGTTFTYTLSEAAKVTITIERKRRRRMRKLGSLSAQKRGGRQSTRFSGRLRGKALKPGRYRATIVATDAAGQASDPRRISFRVVRG
jgi:hypothetical protein